MNHHEHPLLGGCFNLQRILILANGELPDIGKARRLTMESDYTICADGGTRHASALNLVPDLVIGDMDSAETSLLKRFQDEDVPIELYPRDKNETDLELAIAHAIDLDARKIVIAAALGGRLDQTIANIALLAAPRLMNIDIRLDDGVEEILCCRDQIHVQGRIGDIVSLIPWQGAVSGVKTEHLKWSLDDETLHHETTRGISNEMTSDIASIKISSGLLLVVHTRK